MDKKINLDIVRIFAALMVLSVHIGQRCNFNFSVGAKGVQLFFILSGYLAFASLDKNCSIKEYYKKRVVRIIPTYWICLLLIYLEDICLGIYGGQSFAEIFNGQCGPKFLRYFFFLQTVIPSNNWDLWNNHSALWTMSCFAGFYICAPLLYKIMKKFYLGLGIVIISLFGTPWIARYLQDILSGYPTEAHIEWFAAMNPLTELYCFIIGGFLFFILSRQKEYYLIILFVVIIITSFKWYPYELIFTLLIAFLVKTEPVFKNSEICKIISWISKGSFTLYLIHPLVLSVEGMLWQKVKVDSDILHAVSMYIFCIGIAYFLYYTIISRVERLKKSN